MDFEAEVTRLMAEWKKTGGSAKIAQALGDLYTAAEDHSAALTWYQTAIRLAVGDSELLDKLEDCAIRGFEKLIARAESTNNRQAHTLKQTYLSFRIASHERRVKARPLDGQLHYQLAKTYYLGNMTDLAIPEFTVALQHEQSRSSSYFYLARCFMRERRFEEALLHFSMIEESVLSGDIREDIRYHKSKCLGELGRSG